MPSGDLHGPGHETDLGEDPNSRCRRETSNVRYDDHRLRRWLSRRLIVGVAPDVVPSTEPSRDKGNDGYASSTRRTSSECATYQEAVKKNFEDAARVTIRGGST